MRHNSGQDVVPVFDGWNRNPDGTLSLIFGYYNRNYVEQPSVPIGPSNNFSPGPADRGQPTFFYTRLNRFIFRVVVPADWGPAKELTWTLTANGQTEKAVGTLGAEWEVESRWDFGGGGSEKNQPPSLEVKLSEAVTLPDTLTLSASVTDDGNPPVRQNRARILNQGQDAFPTLHKGTKGPVNVEFEPPMPRPRGASTAAAGGPGGGGSSGLSVGWVLYRGPVAVDIAPREYQLLPRTGGTAKATMRFRAPGTYVLRVEACDGPLHDQQLVTVVVTGASKGGGHGR
jgi:hypothetical protein